MIAVDVKGFGSLDWRRADELIARGYAAAEAHREALLEHRLDDTAWQAWAAARDARRRTAVPAPDFLSLSGVEAGDASVVRHTLEPRAAAPGQPPARFPRRADLHRRLVENGSVFDKTADAGFDTHLAAGVVMDTIVGPVLIASSTGLDGGWRPIFGIGRIFR